MDDQGNVKGEELSIDFSKLPSQYKDLTLDELWDVVQREGIQIHSQD